MAPHIFTVRNPPRNFPPLEYFLLLFSVTTMTTVLLRNTRTYAESFLASKAACILRHPQCRLRRWRLADLTMANMKKFFGLCINMGLVRKKNVADYSVKNYSSTFCQGYVIPSFRFYFSCASRRWSWCTSAGAGWFWTMEQAAASSWCGQSCVQDPLCSPTTRVYRWNHGRNEEPGGIHSVYAEQSSLPVWDEEVWGVWLGQWLHHARRTVCGERFPNQKWPRTSARHRNGYYVETTTDLNNLQLDLTLTNIFDRSDQKSIYPTSFP